MSEPAYEKAGEEFLTSKIENFSKAEYAVDLVRSATFEEDNPKKEKIFQGIRQILNNENDKMIEVKAVEFFLEVNDWMRKIDDVGYGVIIGGEIEDKALQDYQNTQILSIDSKILEKLGKLVEEGKAKWRKEVPMNPDGRKILEFAYTYFMDKYDEIPENFIRLFPNFEKNKLVAYYVSTRPESGLEEFVKRRMGE